MLIKILLVTILLCLTGCSESYEDRHTFIPPKEYEEKVCTNRCVVERTHCLRACMQRETVLDLGHESIFIESMQQSPVYNSKTTKECNNICKESHIICHRNCGGQVIVDKVCVAFCKKKH